MRAGGGGAIRIRNRLGLQLGLRSILNPSFLVMLVLVFIQWTWRRMLLCSLFCASLGGGGTMQLISP